MVRGSSGLMGLSLIDGPLHVALVVVALAALAGLLVLHRGRRWWLRRVPIAVAVAAVLLAGVHLWIDVAKPWPDVLPPVVYAWVGAGLLALVLLVLGWGRQRWWVRVLAPVGVLLVVLGAADGIDVVYGAYPTVATALQGAPPDTLPASAVLHRSGQWPDPPATGGPLTREWRPPANLPVHGAVTTVPIPGTVSGFPARSAWLYLPPAYLTATPPALPVLVLINGEPGGPRDWLDAGRLAERMDAFAAAHHGLAPVVVMPDGTGGELADPLCTDSSLGRADTYLSQDVVRWVSTHLHVSTDHRRWAVGGLSYGGTCSLQLAVAHPDLFPTFFDASGQERPTLGGQARTVQVAFGGNAAAFAAIDPMQQLAHRTYPGSAGFLVVGVHDRTNLGQQKAVAAAARAAGMSITTEVLPGGHQWRVWGAGLQDALPWLARRMELTS